LSLFFAAGVHFPSFPFRTVSVPESAPLPQPEDVGSPRPPQVIPPSSAAGGTSPVTTESLPDEFILTPELVEEEAIRGDIVIRGAVVLLALLFGWTHFTNTALLVQIRSGEQMASGGILPPDVDPLSYTVADRPWVNLGWLGDIVLAGVHGLVGPSGLSIWTALLSGLAFWLVSRTSVRDISSWWGSLCATCAVVAVFPLLTAGGGVVTVLGLALCVFLWCRWQERPDSTRLWCLPPVLWVWCQLDPSAGLGLILFALLVVGRLLAPDRKEPATAVIYPLGVALLAALIHPFPMELLRAPYDLVHTVHPLLLQYGGANAAEYPQLWQPVIDTLSDGNPGSHLIAALVTAALALIGLLMNRRHLDWSLLLAFVGLNAVGLFAGYNFAAIAVVNCVVATLSGQVWYRANCRLDYTLDSRELLLSRAGRAITVFAIAGLAYWSIGGHMTGAAGRRNGFGFSAALQAQIDGYRDLLGELGVDEFDDHPFHMTPQQGDLLIWSGRRSFTDSRLGHFVQGESNLLEEQQRINAALRSPAEPLTSPAAIAGWAGVWKKGLDAYQISHVVVPLDSPEGYQLWVNLASQAMATDTGNVVRFWQQHGIGGPAAVLYRVGTALVADNRPLSEFLQASQSQASVIEATFRTRVAGDEVRRGLFPRGPTFYETSFLLPEPVVSNDSLTARHFSTRLGLAQRTLGETVAYSHQVIRHARRGLADDPNNFETYLLLGDAYMRLWGAETTLATNRLGIESAERRFYQAVFAWQHAAICRPSDPQPHAALYPLYVQHGDYDLAIRHLDRLKELNGYYTIGQRGVHAAEQAFNESHQQGKRLRDALAKEVDVAREAADGAALGGLENGVRSAMQGHIPGFALELLERDLTLTAQSTELSQLYASLLLLSGRTQEGFEQIERQLATFDSSDPAQAAQWQLTQWLTARANLAADQYGRAIELWEQYCHNKVLTVYDRALPTLPGISGPPGSSKAWAVLHLVTAVESVGRWLPEWELARWQIAMCQLEEGRNLDAASTLESILASNPASALRPQVVTYLLLLTGQELPLLPPGMTAPPGFEAPAARDPSRPPSPSLPRRFEPAATTP
jgi:tetratricopeptide (TPR) repeat protein